MTAWTALLLAGSRPGGDPLAQGFGVPLKALIPLAGEPMVRRPVRALLASPAVARVRVLAQQPDPIRAALADLDRLPSHAVRPEEPLSEAEAASRRTALRDGLSPGSIPPQDERGKANPRLTVEPSADTIAATLLAVAADPAAGWPLLVTTADHALLEPAMIADFTHQAAGADLAIGLVERAALLRRLPASRRTWHRFRGGAYSGANLFALGSPAALRAMALWRSVEQDRKHRRKLLAALGWPGVLALLRLRTLDQTLAAIGRRLGLTIRAVRLADPLACVDVDKPADHSLVEAIVAERA